MRTAAVALVSAALAFARLDAGDAWVWAYFSWAASALGIFLGVFGFVESSRAGRVTVANLVSVVVNAVVAFGWLFLYVSIGQ